MKISAENLTIFACIESGRLEHQTVLMFATLRQFAGALSNAKAVAVIGRKGAKLHSDTYAQLETLNVEIVTAYPFNPAPWFNYSNKIATVQYAEQTATTPLCLWLDSDIFFLKQPTFMNELMSTDFRGRFERAGPIVSDQDTRFVPYWEEACDLVGLSLEKLPFYTLNHPRKTMRPYFNSGVFLWKRQTGFAQQYAMCFSKLLESGLGAKSVGPWFADQVAISLALYSKDLPWEMLEIEDNFMLFQHFLDPLENSNLLEKAAILHYSQSRTPKYLKQFNALFQKAHPEVFEFVETHEAQLPHLEKPHLLDRSRRLQRSLRQKFFIYSAREV